MISGGHPRFTVDFLHLMQQLEGFESADLYLNFWNSDWASSEEEGHSRIEKILMPRYKLAKLKIINPPGYELPAHTLNHPPAQPENIRWWYERRIGMWRSLAMAYDLIEGDYDVVIRFRPDGMLGSTLDISSLNVSENKLIIPKNGCGYKNYPVNDQFAVGTYTAMSLYKDIVKNYNNLIVEAEPDWERKGHDWSGEHIMGYYLNKNNKKYSLGNFDHILTTKGRSQYTDKHFHLPITKDITI